MSAPNLAGGLRKPSEFREDDRLQTIHGLEPPSDHADHEHKLKWIELARIGFVALATAAVWLRIWDPLPRVSVIGVLATLIGGYPIFKEAWENIVERKMAMELSMTIALLAALAIGEFFTALVITGFVLAAEVLEGLAVGVQPASIPLRARSRCPESVRPRAA